MEITLRIWHMFRTISVQHEKIIQTCDFFRTISVHSFEIFHYLCTGKSKQNSANMAGTVKDMSLIKQVLQLKQLGESNRGIAKKLPINKETVNSYMSKVESNKWTTWSWSVCSMQVPQLIRMCAYRTFCRCCPTSRNSCPIPRTMLQDKFYMMSTNRSSPMAMDSPSSITISSKIFWPRKM